MRGDFWSRHPMVERGKAPSRAQNVSVRYRIASPSAHADGGTARRLLPVLHDALTHVVIANGATQPLGGICQLTTLLAGNANLLPERRRGRHREPAEAQMVRDSE